ncbi:MAG: acyltransferase [Nanoarchaeota archaeon]|nr:acyltransferase [Nanoarchaeota archaeon]MBU1622606.1 acyltransferase [Nanoarchaeota archaeon]
MLFYKFIKKLKLFYYRHKGIKIGKDCEISPQAYLDCHRPNKRTTMLRIGNNVRISRWTMIVVADTVDLDHPEIPWNKRKIKYSPVVIGSNVFIGAQTVVLPGTTIGENVVIGANSVVKGVIPDNVVAAGSPARVIKKI